MLADKLHAEEMPHINMTPMVDVVLCLLVFFMVATRLYDWDESQFNVKVPEVGSAAPLTQAPDDLLLTIVEPGRVEMLGTVLELDALAEALTDAHTRFAEQAVQIRGDGDLSYQALADVLAACDKAGIANVRLRVRPKNDEAPAKSK
jgi:biopolymer transport protein ExbD